MTVTHPQTQTHTTVPALGTGTVPAELVADLLDLGLVDVLERRTEPVLGAVREGLASAVAGPADYTRWLRGHLRAWTGACTSRALRTGRWPLASVGPQLLDLAALITSDLRDLSPAGSPTPAARNGEPPEGAAAAPAAAYLAVRLASELAPVLGPARALWAGRFPEGAGTRYLERCADLASRRAAVTAELALWAHDHGPEDAVAVVRACDRFSGELGTSLRTGGGW